MFLKSTNGQPVSRLHGWIRLYSFLTLASVLYGVGVAHLFGVIGPGFTTSPNTASVLVVHLFEVPIVAYVTFVAIFALRRLRPETMPTYYALLGFANVANLVFFAFEIQLLFASAVRGAPALELGALTSITVILLTAVAMGLAIQIGLRSEVGVARVSAPSAPSGEQKNVA